MKEEKNIKERRSLMRKLLILFLALAFVAGFSTASLAVITGSAHDFSGLPNTRSEICLPCHAPHNNQLGITDAPLWNHEVSQAVYTTYTSPTMDAGTPPGNLDQPGGVSKLCLSCHDGTVAIDAFGGQPGSIFLSPNSDENLGTDLSNDHPISFIYDTALAQVDGELFDPSTALSGIIGTAGGSIQDEMLFADKLECASCHDVHNAFNTDELLLKPNGGSGLCLTCHNK
jgi:predicted CXXCH cytochrome family protein